MFITRLIHYTKKKTFFNFIFIAIFYQLRFEAYQSLDIANVIEQFTLKFFSPKNCGLYSSAGYFRVNWVTGTCLTVCEFSIYVESGYVYVISYKILRLRPRDKPGI